MKKFESALKEWAGSLPKGSCCSTRDSNIKFEEQKSSITFVNKSKKFCLKVNVDPVSSPLIQKGMKKISALNAKLIVVNTPASYLL